MLDTHSPRWLQDRRGFCFRYPPFDGRLYHQLTPFLGAANIDRLLASVRQPVLNGEY